VCALVVFLCVFQSRFCIPYVIRPSYEIHQSMGLLSYTMDGQKREEDMTFRNFFSGRILWDESMASNAYKWTSQNPGGVLIGLVGADHGMYLNHRLQGSCKSSEWTQYIMFHNFARQLLLFSHSIIHLLLFFISLCCSEISKWNPRALFEVH
jgi:Haem-binding uptake, Tiki superfamily, ChaN